MIWCWTQAVLLELAVLGVVLGMLLAVFGAVAGVAIAAERAPSMVQTLCKRVMLGCLALVFVAFVIAITIKSQQKVCAVGFRAAWSSVWNPQPARR